MSIAAEQCQPVSDPGALMTLEPAQQLLAREIPAWQLITHADCMRLQRTFPFEDFATALAFANQVGALAEAVAHHPVIELTWGRATLTWWSHSIDGLQRADFIMAARCDKAYLACVEGEEVSGGG